MQGLPGRDRDLTSELLDPTASPEPDPSDGPARPRRRWPWLVAALGLALVVVVSAIGLNYRRQIVSYLTHWKGGPSSTEPWQPHVPPPDVHIAVAGDVGDSGSRLDATGAEIARIGEGEPYDALLLLGDNVYPAGDPAKLPGTVFGPFAGVLDQGADLLAILGNHDVKGGKGDEQLAALGQPGRFWSHQIGDVLVVGLDSNTWDDPRQLRFLEETLASTTASWKIVALHHPPYSAGYQGSSVDIRDRYAPIFERYGVQLVLSGHDHDYQRSVPIGGVTYVVSGAAAGTRRTGEADFTAESFSWHHFVDIAVTGDRLTLRAVGQDGRVADEATIELDASSV